MDALAAAFRSNFLGGQHAAPRVPAGRAPRSSAGGNASFLGGAAVGAIVGITIERNLSASRLLDKNSQDFLPNGFSYAPFACASLSTSVADTANEHSAQERKESKTGLTFPLNLEGQQLLGLGVRNKNLFGLANIKVYAFGLQGSMLNTKAL